MKKQIVFLDADGVLLDSVDETILSCWNGYNRFNGSQKAILDLEDVPSNIVDGMRLYRPLACTFLDNLRILHAIVTQQDLSSAEIDSLEGVVSLEGINTQQFKDNVDNFRRVELAANRDKYLKVMRVYEEAADHYAQLVCSSDYEVYIATNKMAEHVATALRAYSYPVSQDKIINGSHSGSKTDQICGIVLEAGLDFSQAHFVDDHVPALIRVKNDPRLGGISVYVAGWGYVNDNSLATAKREDIPVLAQSDVASRFPLC
ncbi:hypothetical protein HYY69_06070 [Candidatus Woesearchaeota archaeon]|nr:hypothetical protein [Candidatus Woesearchaeota archaeon]